jgi:hypothetical protein
VGLVYQRSLVRFSLRSLYSSPPHTSGVYSGSVANRMGVGEVIIIIFLGNSSVERETLKGGLRRCRRDGNLGETGPPRP